MRRGPRICCVGLLAIGSCLPATAELGVDWIKAIPAQLAACALVERERELRVLLGLREPHDRRAEALRAYAASYGLRYEPLAWGTLDEWHQRLRREISLVLQCSYSETFNYVTLDAASCGRPFVASYAIEHTPAAWKVTDPNNAAEIAKVLRFILDNYREERAKARLLAEKIAQRQNRQYAATIRRLLARSEVDDRGRPEALLAACRACPEGKWDQDHCRQYGLKACGVRGILQRGLFFCPYWPSELRQASPNEP